MDQHNTSLSDANAFRAPIPFPPFRKSNKIFVSVVRMESFDKGCCFSCLDVLCFGAC